MKAVTWPRRVGISIFVRRGYQSLWENGIFQNCLFLAMLFKRMPGIEEVCLVAGGDGDMYDARSFLGETPVPIIPMAAAVDRLDLMIEMSAQLDRNWVVDFREKGGKVVSMRVGNDYVIDIERMIFGCDPGLLINEAPYHGVWTLREFEKTCVPYFRTLFRAPVTIVPHLWSPAVLDRAISQLPNGQTFGYQPGRRRWRIGIFEPNLCMVKTSFVPILGCEVAHRRDPDRLQSVHAYNTEQMTTRAGWAEFASSLDLTRHGLIRFESRHRFYQAAATATDAIVSHQWENAQNYLYYEALYGGYPLIHNSRLIGDCGYYYPEFDVEALGETLLRAQLEHDANAEIYRRVARNFLRTLAPEEEVNVQAYHDAVARLYG